MDSTKVQGRPLVGSFYECYHGESSQEYCEDLVTKIEELRDEYDIEPCNGNLVGFESRTELSMHNNGRKFVRTLVSMDVQDFVHLQRTKIFDNVTEERYWSMLAMDYLKDKLIPAYENGEVPPPYVEFQKGDGLQNLQEGRHRAKILQIKGIDMIPVHFVLKIV